MIELIWDANGTGTATGPSGASLEIGEAQGLLPDDLLAMAAASCLMRTFLRLAADARIPVLSYAATAHVETRRHDPRPHVTVRAFVMGPSDVSERELGTLFADAQLASPVARVLGERLHATAEHRVLRSAAQGAPA